MDSSNSKNKLLISITHIIFSEGITISIDEIARRLHISKKTIYKHFKSKDDILEHLIESLMKRGKTVFERSFDMGKDPIDAILEAFTEIPKLFSILSKKFLDDIRKYEPDKWQRIDNYRSKLFMEYFPRVYSIGIKKGYFKKDIKLDILLLVYLGSLQSVINPTVLSQSSFSVFEAVQNIIKIIFQGVTTEKGKSKFKISENKIKNNKEMLYEI